jgi:hypothetical protein
MKTPKLSPIVIGVVLAACAACRSGPDSHGGHHAAAAKTSTDVASAAAAHVNTAVAPSPAPAGMM